MLEFWQMVGDAVEKVGLEKGQWAELRIFVRPTTDNADEIDVFTMLSKPGPEEEKVLP